MYTAHNLERLQLWDGTAVSGGDLMPFELLKLATDGVEVGSQLFHYLQLSLAWEQGVDVKRFGFLVRFVFPYFFEEGQISIAC